MRRIHAHLLAHAHRDGRPAARPDSRPGTRPGARFSASDRPLPTARPTGVPTGAGSAAAEPRLTLPPRARITAAMFALVALVALASAAPTALLVLLSAFAITIAVVGGAFLLVERRTRPRDGAAREPDYLATVRGTRRNPC